MVPTQTWDGTHTRSITSTEASEQIFAPCFSSSFIACAFATLFRTTQLETAALLEFCGATIICVGLLTHPDAPTRNGEVQRRRARVGARVLQLRVLLQKELREETAH